MVIDTSAIAIALNEAEALSFEQRIADDRCR